MKKLDINKEKCTKCGNCVKHCDFGIIELDKDGYPQFKEGCDSSCLNCQHCLATCATGAFSINGKSSENSEVANMNIKPEDMLELIKNRRSCRKYKHENVDKETMQKLKDMLKYVPTGCNNHGLHFSIIEDVEIMDVFNKTANSKMRTLLKFVPVFGMLKKFKKAIMEGCDIIFQGAPHLIAVSVPKNAPCKDIDPVIALSYFELYANSLGLGTLWCGFAYGLLKSCPCLLKKLNIPKTHKIGYVMLFGKPDTKFYRTTQPEDCSFSIIKEV